MKSLAIEKELNNRRFIALNLNNVGTKYSLLKDHKQAINYYQQALEIEESLKDSILSAISLYSIGSSYIDLGEYARAHIFIEKALKILEVKPNDESSP